MNGFHGHHQVLAALREHLPPVTLLRGPASVGKWTMTHHLADHHAVTMADRQLWPDGLGIDAVRAITAFTSTAPFGAFKLVAARLDETSAAAANALLKTLEEPPPAVRFLFTASAQVPATVVSRCAVYRLGPLRPDELREILTGHGLARTAAEKAAALGGGQVRPALRAAGHSDAAHGCALSVLRAVATGDRDGFERACRGIDDAVRELLVCWLREALTGQWAAFNPADDLGLHRDRRRLRAFAAALGRFAAAQPRLGVRAALEPFLDRA